MLRFNYLIAAICLVSGFLRAQMPAVPSEAQLKWHDTEFYLFFHFGPNTFTDLEWGHGTEADSLFQPSELDCDQWCRIALAAGARGVVITAKHHDGFCLWPSRYSRHTVRESGWKGGHGDVLKELSEACRRHGLKFGLYLSPWDRNHPQYGSDAYNDVYVNTLTEVLTGYGPLFEIWWDGANGEGPNGKKQIYDFHRFEKLAKKYQPDAIIFSDIGPGCRWAGNEQGTVNETNWCMLDTVGYGRGATGPPASTLQTGQENGACWIPAECDVSIRPGWFYHQSEDDKVKSPEELFRIYLQSVGRGANLILNVPPDRRGKIADPDSVSLVAFGKQLHDAFDDNLAFQRPCRVSSAYKAIDTRALTDGNKETAYSFGAVKDGTVAWAEIDLGVPTAVDCIRLYEKLRRSGQNIASFTIEIETNGAWKTVVQSTTIGARKILCFPETMATKVRITLSAAKNPPALTEIQLFNLP